MGHGEVVLGCELKSRQQINGDLISVRKELQGMCTGFCNVFIFGIIFPPPSLCKLDLIPRM